MKTPYLCAALLLLAACSQKNDYDATGRFVRYADLTTVDGYIQDDLETACKHIRDKLIAGVDKRLDADAPLGFLLSGGLDSSLVCAISAVVLGRKIRTFAIGMDIDAIDLKYARQVAEYIGSDHREIIITKEDVLSSLETVVELLGTFSTSTSNWIVTKRATWIAITYSQQGYEPGTAKVYTSQDNGINWNPATDNLQLPATVNARYDAQAFVCPHTNNSALRAIKPITEWDTDYVYIFGGSYYDSYSRSTRLYNQMWRGVIERLTFKPLQ